MPVSLIWCSHIDRLKNSFLVFHPYYNLSYFNSIVLLLVWIVCSFLCRGRAIYWPYKFSSRFLTLYVFGEEEDCCECLCLWQILAYRFFGGWFGFFWLIPFTCNHPEGIFIHIFIAWTQLQLSVGFLHSCTFMIF